MKKNRILINTIMSILLIVVNCGVLLLIYRLIITTLGVKSLGLWSLVFSTVSISRIADLGFSDSLVKYTAKYSALGQNGIVGTLIQTVFISFCIFFGFICFIAYLLASWIFPIVVPNESLEEALSLLPFSLLAIWLFQAGSVFQASLHGFQLIAHRCAVAIIAALIYLMLSYILIPTHGLFGLAYAHLIQISILGLGYWFLLKHKLPLLPVCPHQWSYKLLREMLSSGLSFQVISICKIVYELLTTWLLTKFGGLDMTGFYDMAHRIVLNLDAVIGAANRVLVPAVAELQEKEPEMIRDVYKKLYKYIFYITLPSFSSIVLLSPLISQIWIGHHEATFINFTFLLSFAWFFYVLSGPSYITNWGTGEMFWNTVGHVAICISTLILCPIGGYFIGGYGVILGYVISIILGSLMICISYHIENHLSLDQLLPKENIGIVLTSTIGIFVYLLLNFSTMSFVQTSYFNFELFTIIMLILLIAISTWFNPIRKILLESIVKGFPKTLSRQ